MKMQQGGEHCVICGDGPDPDIRTLRIGHGYDLTEVSEKFERIEIAESEGGRTVPAWKLKTCKSCRADLMTLLRRWIEEGSTRRAERELENSDPARCIPVRFFGGTVMLTEDEWHEMRARRA